MAVQRLSREEKSRESTARAKGWVSPSLLEAPEPPFGKRYKWIRCEANGQEDTSNLMKAFAQGYEPVRLEEVPKGFAMDVFNDGKYQGVVRKRDAMLCVIDEEIVKDRTRQINELTKRQQGIVNGELLAQSGRYMQVDKPSVVTTSTVGRPEFQED